MNQGKTPQYPIFVATDSKSNGAALGDGKTPSVIREIFRISAKAAEKIKAADLNPNLDGFGLSIRLHKFGALRNDSPPVGDNGATLPALIIFRTRANDGKSTSSVESRRYLNGRFNSLPGPFLSVEELAHCYSWPTETVPLVNNTADLLKIIASREPG